MNKMRQIMTIGAFALTTALTVVPAHADNFDLGTIAEGQTKGVVLSHTSGSFSDFITFSTTKGGNDAFAQYSNFLVNMSSNLSNVFLNLTGPSSQSFGLSDGLNKQITLAAGNYTANVTGDVTGTDGGAYNFRIAAPTPEPEVWLSMIFGLGMAGFMARRRKQRVTATVHTNAYA